MINLSAKECNGTLCKPTKTSRSLDLFGFQPVAKVDLIRATVDFFWSDEQRRPDDCMYFRCADNGLVNAAYGCRGLKNGKLVVLGLMYFMRWCSAFCSEVSTFRYLDYD